MYGGGVTPIKHNNAIYALNVWQIKIISFSDILFMSCSVYFTIVFASLCRHVLLVS